MPTAPEKSTEQAVLHEQPPKLFDALEKIPEAEGLVKTTKGDLVLKTGVDELLRQVLDRAVDSDMVLDDGVLELLSALIHKLDEKLSSQLNAILHHADFQKLEGDWRGLEHMVFGTETDKDLKIRVFNVRKSELGQCFKKFKGAAWDQSPLFRKIYTDEYDTYGGHPFGTLIGAFEFGKSAADVDILKGMGAIAAAAHAPFIAAAAPELLGLDTAQGETWQNLDQIRDVAGVMEGPEWASFRGFRESLDSRYVGLTLPRFLARLPYGKENPVEGFAFEEQCEGGDHSKYTWSNAAFALGTNITQAHKFYGWTACIRGPQSGGEVTGMHVHTFPTDDGGVEMKCPTEVSIPGRREHELARVGLSAIVHEKNTDRAVFFAARSLYQSKEYDDPVATANSKLNGGLPYVFVVSRFAHYIQQMVRKAVGSFQERSDLERWLNNWIAGYVTQDDTASQEVKARYPLRDAKVSVEEVPGEPGYYSAVFHLRPHYQLEGVNASLRLVSKVSKKS
jgi:type VI secretion system protein ImpC